MSAQYPQEDVAGFASYLLSQWQSLLSSSVYAQDVCSPAAASGGLSAAASANLYKEQTNVSAQLPCGAATPAAQARQQQHGHGHQSPLHLRSAQQPQAKHVQRDLEPQGFRPYRSRRASSALPQSEQGNSLRVAEEGMMSRSALGCFTRSTADLSQAARAAVGGVPVLQGPEMTEASRLHSTACADDAATKPGVQGRCDQAPQAVQGYQPLQQLQSLPGYRPTQSVLQAFDGTFLKHVQSAPAGQAVRTALRSPVSEAEPEEQVCAFSGN